VIALVLSAARTRLSAAALLELLRPAPTAVAAGGADPGAVNAAVALERLDGAPRRSCTAARSGAGDARGCPALAGHSLDGL